MPRKPTFSQVRLAEKQAECRARQQGKVKVVIEVKPMKENKIIKDTGFSNSLETYKEIITENGFKQVILLPFQRDDYVETFQLWYKEDEGLLLEFDTYRGYQINAGHI